MELCSVCKGTTHITVDGNIIYTDIQGDIYVIDKNTFSAIAKKKIHHTQINSYFLSFCAGGANARNVTMTKSKGNFNTKAFDCVTSRQIGYYKLYFGTVNVFDIHPSGKTLASGAEDGLVSLIRLDDFSFCNAPFSTF